MNREGEIYVLLAQLDLKSIRPLSENDTVRLAALNAEKEALRQELRDLQDAAANVNQ
tara:strand:+ start:1411 stop:1581 length:171 start_codon:yes stop_codon:yes gene_type:complete